MRPGTQIELSCPCVPGALRPEINTTAVTTCCWFMPLQTCAVMGSVRFLFDFFISQTSDPPYEMFHSYIANRIRYTNHVPLTVVAVFSYFSFFLRFSLRFSRLFARHVAENETFCARARAHIVGAATTGTPSPTKGRISTTITLYICVGQCCVCVRVRLCIRAACFSRWRFFVCCCCVHVVRRATGVLFRFLTKQMVFTTLYVWHGIAKWKGD